ncbi:MAG: diiron oxygenase [Actinomycetota bacterium]|nr:diiron oxygenase [Actinomycetota bacterium]
MTTTLAPELPRTARRARQLVAVSERTTLDPFTEVDWDISIDDSAFHLPPEVLPLYGTEAWQAMSEQERIAYSRHETAALCGAGIWFENVLMQAVLRHLQELPVTDPAHRYLLVEVADECRHSMMFGEFIRRADTPAYRPAMNPLTVSDLPGGRAMSYLLILAVEELLDHINRATMRDERVHPVSRKIAKVHVLEEARHVSFAKSYLSEVWPMLDEETRTTISALAPDLVAVVADLSVDDAVYDHLGIEGGAAMARANPHHQAVVVAGLGKLTAFLAHIGVIDAVNLPGWRARGLL